jgi:hypothetical protein
VSIADKDRKLLWGLAHNRCAICRTPLVLEATSSDPKSIVGDEAHIVAQSPTGPRAGSLSSADLDRYENLILLCKVHHKLVDDQPIAYTVDRLREIKAEHEDWAESLFGNREKVISARNPEIIRCVPRSDEELVHVIGTRPWSWEYLLYAGTLHLGLLERRSILQRSPFRLPASFNHKAAVIAYVQKSLADLQQITQRLEACVDPALQSKAFGDIGVPGDFRLISELADRMLKLYDGYHEWRAGVSGAKVSRPYRTIVECLGQVADRPMRDIEVFVEALVRDLDETLTRVRNGVKTPQIMTLICNVTVDESLMRRLLIECQRAK